MHNTNRQQTKEKTKNAYTNFKANKFQQILIEKLANRIGIDTNPYIGSILAKPHLENFDLGMITF